ncbi:MAG: hypothetical protein ACOCWJ_04695 [Verrucomicrobiota bacterium]
MPSETTHLPWENAGESVLVVAHPDDEALWFSAAASHVDRIIICFAPPGAETGTAAALRDSFPLAHTEFLNLSGFRGYSRRHFALPLSTRAGLLLWAKPHSEWRYRLNARRLRELLAPRLSSETRVITHSPWGDYGHEEHVQVHTVLSTLAREHSFQLWHTNYAASKSLTLLRRTAFRRQCSCATTSTNPELLARMKAFYIKHNVWTWHTEWTGFEQETYIRPNLDSAMRAYTPSHPLNLFKLHY